MWSDALYVLYSLSSNKFLHLNSVSFGCFVLRNLDYSCPFHWIMGSGQIRDNLKMCRGRQLRLVLPHFGSLCLYCLFKAKCKHQSQHVITRGEKNKMCIRSYSPSWKLCFANAASKHEDLKELYVESSVVAIVIVVSGPLRQNTTHH